MKRPQLFLSYSGDDAFEASLLQYALESMMPQPGVKVWTYQRDQSKSQRSIAVSLKDRVRASNAMVFLVSPATLASGAAQWMELAYADAFGVPTFVLLHHLTFADIKSRERGVPPLLLEGQCNAAADWRTVAKAICKRLKHPSPRRR